MTSVRVNDVELAYSDRGAGPLVLYAHGLTASRAADQRAGLIDFSAVARVARFVAYDARGHGESSGGESPEQYAWPSLADDLLALAERLSPDAPVSGIGLSMGTATLLHAALKQPKRWQRLVLTAPPTAWETRAGQAQLYASLVALAERLSPEELRAQLARVPVAPIFRDLPNYPAPPDIAHQKLPAVLRGAGMSNLPARETLRAITQPTLILAWDTDAGHPLSTAESLAELLPHAELHVSKTSADIRTWGERAAQFLAR